MGELLVGESGEDWSWSGSWCSYSLVLRQVAEKVPSITSLHNMCLLGLSGGERRAQKSKDRNRNDTVQLK